MINEGVVHGTTSPPSRLDVAKWVHAAMLEMKGREKLFGRHGYEWFVNNTGEQDVGGNKDGLEQAL